MVDVISITALVISVVALLTTILQVLQQYFGSAEGYRRCAKSVMGKWHRGTQRRFNSKELRFEVIFETPVMFTAPSSNTKGPIPERPIHYIDGSAQSYKDTWTTERGQEKEEARDAIRRVHTADDERASWVTLLSSLQLLEFESRSWEEKKRCTPRGQNHDEPKYTLSVGLQKKKRSWDFMPAAVYKPFATTTICHLVEMATILGMFWKTFDSRTWRMRAEGNGFILTSILVPGLGIMVTFSITGAHEFQENRIIPSSHIKEWAFGSVPSIFINSAALRILTVGSNEEAINTLELLGCSIDDVVKYGKKRKHIFSVAFDIIGMLALPVRIRGSNFKMLPNPTMDHFQPSSFSRCKLMFHFQSKLSILIDELSRASNSSLNSALDRDSDATEKIPNDENMRQLMQIVDHWTSMSSYWPKGSDDPDSRIDIDLREAIHDALDQSSEFLVAKPIDSVCSVVSSHISVILHNLESNLLDSPNNLNTSLQGLSGRRSEGEEKLITIYFRDIRPKVVESGLSRDEEETAAVEDGDPAGLRNAIWCTLVFRMICWLLLHDFDKSDVKITPSDLKGSRMPVYIG